MSHPSTIRHAIWDAVRTLYRDLRRAVSSATEHDGEALVATASVAGLEAVLGVAYFAPNWEFSYYERGEDLNLARVVYDRREIEGHEFVWWQTHVRGWQFVDDEGRVRTRLRPHYELEPTEYDQDHLNRVGLDVGAGVDAVAAVLKSAGIDFERFEDLPAGGR